MNNPTKGTIGQAIDQTLSALAALERREQQIVISTICSILNIDEPAAKSTGRATKHTDDSTATSSRQHPTEGADAPPDQHHTSNASPAREAADDHGIDIRTLRNEKQPTNALQMACIVAYYLQEHAPRDERTKEVTAADVERLFKQAGYKLPSRTTQLLVDTKAAGYFESVDRGKYRLTRVGYNLVTHSLPKGAAT
jgi:hypothetical protein